MPPFPASIQRLEPHALPSNHLEGAAGFLWGQVYPARDSDTRLALPYDGLGIADPLGPPAQPWDITVPDAQPRPAVSPVGLPAYCQHPTVANPPLNGLVLRQPLRQEATRTSHGQGPIAFKRTIDHTGPPTALQPKRRLAAKPEGARPPASTPTKAPKPRPNSRVNQSAIPPHSMATWEVASYGVPQARTRSSRPCQNCQVQHKQVSFSFWVQQECK